jgi:hypothetical protein
MDDFSGGVVRRIDPATNKVTATTRGLAGPAGFAFSGSDVWVALHHAQSVVELDGKTGRVLAHVAVPAAEGGVLASGPSGVAVGFGSVWTSAPNIDATVRLDPVARKVVAVVHGAGGGDVAVADGSVWAVDGGDVVRIDPKSNAVNARIKVAANADQFVAPLAVLDGRVWAAPGNSIVEIDPGSAKVISRTVIAKAFFKDLQAGAGALWAWDGNTNKIDELHTR